MTERRYTDRLTKQRDKTLNTHWELRLDNKTHVTYKRVEGRETNEGRKTNQAKLQNGPQAQ